jgi:FMN phosphatase YigB (HAD superfamily)
MLSSSSVEPPKAAIFKLSDVLINETESSKQALRTVGRNLLGLTDIEDQKKFATTALDALGAKWKGCSEYTELTDAIGRGQREMLFFGTNEGAEALHAELQPQANALFKTIGAFRGEVWDAALEDPWLKQKAAEKHVDSSALQEAAMKARWEPNTAVLVPGARDLLTTFQENNVLCAVVTNGLSNWQRKILNHADLNAFVGDRVVVSGDGNYRSSSKEIVQDAKTKLESAMNKSLSPDEIIFIGNQNKDISAANDAGITQTYLFEDPQSAKNPVFGKNQLRIEAVPSVPPEKIADLSEVPTRIGIAKTASTEHEIQSVPSLTPAAQEVTGQTEAKQAAGGQLRAVRTTAAASSALSSGSAQSQPNRSRWRRFLDKAKELCVRGEGRRSR